VTIRTIRATTTAECNARHTGEVNRGSGEICGWRHVRRVRQAVECADAGIDWNPRVIIRADRRERRRAALNETQQTAADVAWRRRVNVRMIDIFTQWNARRSRRINANKQQRTWESDEASGHNENVEPMEA